MPYGRGKAGQAGAAVKAVRGRLGPGGSVAAILAATLLPLAAMAAPAGAEFGLITKWRVATDEPAAVNGVATDPSGNVYAAARVGFPATAEERPEIRKFTSEGTFITKWGSEGSADGQFSTASDVAVGPDGSVYVADGGNNRIQKFTSDGTFASKWGSQGSANGQFNGPIGVTTDPGGNVYVADTGNNRVQKFTSDGTFITKWPVGVAGDPGELDEQPMEYEAPGDVATDSEGTVYVTARFLPRIEKFTSDGTFVSAWWADRPGATCGLCTPTVATDPAGNLYVAEYWAGGVAAGPPFTALLKFTSDGTFLGAFQCFTATRGVATDSGGNVYIGDAGEIAKYADPGVPKDCHLALVAERKSQYQKLRRLRVFATCPEEGCQVTARGQASAERHGREHDARLRSEPQWLAAGEKTKIRLHFKRERALHRFERLLERESVEDARAFVKVNAVDAAGNRDQDGVADIRLRP